MGAGPTWGFTGGFVTANVMDARALLCGLAG